MENHFGFLENTRELMKTPISIGAAFGLKNLIMDAM